MGLEHLIDKAARIGLKGDEFFETGVLEVMGFKKLVEILRIKYIPEQYRQKNKFEKFAGIFSGDREESVIISSGKWEPRAVTKSEISSILSGSCVLNSGSDANSVAEELISKGIKINGRGESYYSLYFTYDSENPTTKEKRYIANVYYKHIDIIPFGSE